MNLARITWAAEVVIEAKAAEAVKDLHALAESMRRSIGQRARWDLVQWKRETTRA